MEKVIYLCLKEGCVVHSPQVRVGDIATILGREQALMEKVKQVPLVDFAKEEHPVTGVTAMFVMQKIMKNIPEVSLVNVGTTELVVEYVMRTTHPLWDRVKMVFVGLVLFFGGAFSIMSFHNDVGLRGTFSQLYYQLTGRMKPPVTPLEVGYSVGVFLGIVIFFNHVGGKKLTHDPTPIQVQMRQYEKNVEQTFLATSERKGVTKDV